MKYAIDETARRRSIQQAYNEAHGITPVTIKKAVRDVIELTKKAEAELADYEDVNLLELTKGEMVKYAAKLEKEMRKASKMLEFEYAAVLRDRIIKLRGEK